MTSVTSMILLVLAPSAAWAGGTEPPTSPPPRSPTVSDKSSSLGRPFVLPQYQYQYPGASGGGQWRQTVPMAGPPGGFYRAQQDKSTYRSSGFLTSKSAPNPALGLSYTPRVGTLPFQDNLQNRIGGFGGFNLPPSGPSQHRFLAAAGGLRPQGGFNLPLVPPYHSRDSRVLDNISYKPRDPSKKTGVYVVPSPSKLYYDGVKQ